MLKNIMLVCFSIMLWGSCAEISSFQTGRTIPKDEGEFGASLNVTGVRGAFDGENYGAAVIGLWGRYGAGEKTDIGLKISTGLNLLFDVKHQLIGDQESRFALSVGGALGVFAVGRLIPQYHLPIYLSIHPTERIAWYLTPRYINQHISKGVNANYLGSSLGVLFGKKVKFGVDLSYASILGTELTVEDTNLGTGVFNVGFGIKVPIQ